MLKGAFKRAVLHKVAGLSAEELEELRNDLNKQIAVRGSEAVTSVIPEGPLQRKLQEVAEGSSTQRGNAIRGAIRNAALYGGGGALALGALQGPQAAPQGLLMGAVPSAFSGYFDAKNSQRQQEIGDILRGQNKVDNIDVTS